VGTVEIVDVFWILFGNLGRSRAAGRVAAAALLLAAGGSGAQAVNDYPTAARADYVFACMAVNDGTREALERCSCSIDHIASVLPHEAYVTAETLLRTAQASGERGQVFRGSERLQLTLEALRRAQAEADILCFF
jgi:hypothetical protein